MHHLYTNLFSKKVEELVGEIYDDPEKEDFPSEDSKAFFLATGEKDTEISSLKESSFDYQRLTKFRKRA